MNNYAMKDLAIGAASAQIQQGMLNTIALNQRQMLEMELEKATANVARLKELLALFDRNPELARVFELLGQRY